MEKTNKKRTGAIAGTIALTFAIGGALIFGNAALAVRTMAEEPEVGSLAAGSVAEPESADLTAQADGEQDREATGTATVDEGDVIEVETMDGSKVKIIETSGEDRIGEMEEVELPDGEDVSVAFITRALENGATVLVEYSYGEDGAIAAVRHGIANGQPESYIYEGEAAEAAIERFGGPRRDIPERCVKGQPGDGDVTEEAAIHAGVEAVKEKYALRRETIDQFKVTAVYYVTYEDLPAPVWWVNLYPVNTDDFQNLGCYTAILNGETGEILQTLSAADGKGQGKR
jgi:hypothetical protein